MIITKTQLRKIIKEEIEKVAKEQGLNELFGFGKKKTPRKEEHSKLVMDTMRKKCPAWMASLSLFADKLDMPMPKDLFGRVRIDSAEDEKRMNDLLGAIQKGYPLDWQRMQSGASEKCKDAMARIPGFPARSAAKE